MLTMTFLGLEARTDLPKVPYSTALDLFLWIAYGFIFASIVQVRFRLQTAKRNVNVTSNTRLHCRTHLYALVKVFKRKIAIRQSADVFPFTISSVRLRALFHQVRLRRGVLSSAGFVL